MKNLINITLMLIISSSLFSQAPNKFSYQGVVRDASNNLIVNQTITVQLSIIQGTSNGSIIFVETHSPVTNANGLFSIEVGGGNLLLGNFSTINWGAGPYFIGTDIDPTGGGLYTITGVTELLSVPYALHAKTAESISGSIVENDPVYATSPASSITSADITNWNNDSVNVYTAGNGISITNNIISTTEPTYSLGLNDSLGGCVFYLTPNQKHGLVITTNFQGDATWYAAVDSISNAVNYNSVGKQFTDWRLPTAHEIWLVDNFSGGTCGDQLGWFVAFWTVQEIDSTTIRTASYLGGTLSFQSDYKTSVNRVKAVRSF